MSEPIPHLPILRFGRPYESLDRIELKAIGSGETVALVSQCNDGLLRRDLKKAGEAAEALRAIPAARLLEISEKAAPLFMQATLPLGSGHAQSPQQYIAQLSTTTGLPHTLCRRNMAKIEEVFARMPQILRGLMRGLDPSALDGGLGEQNGIAVSFFALARAMGVVLPSNSPGVNSIWMPAIVLKTPVVLKPGREDPWTPWRIIQAFIAAGAPAEAFGFYPTDHAGSATIMAEVDRALIFGDEGTVGKVASDPRVQAHGPGWSKILIGEDMIGEWAEHLDILVQSISANGGRSCVNASAVVVPRLGREIAEALAGRLAAIVPRQADDPDALLAGFANPKMAEMIDAVIEADLQIPGAEDLAAKRRGGPRRITLGACHYLSPAIIHCDSWKHPLANREFLFPCASVVEMPQDRMIESIGPTLVCSALTRDPKFIRSLMAASNIDRLNIGAIPTTRVDWTQPHEGNLFEFLWRRRAIQMEPAPAGA